MRLAFLHLLLCISCFLAFAQQTKEESSGLQPGDHVRIRPGKANPGVARRLHLDLDVNDRGQLTLPGFGLTLDVRNLQAIDAATMIQGELRESSGIPELEVTVLSSRNGLPLPEQNCLAIGGQVREPGQIPFQPGMTLASALNAAGGTTTFAATNRIKLYRGGDLFTYDLGNPKHATSRLRRHDILEVPAKLWASH